MQRPSWDTRFFANVAETPNGCLEWTGYCGSLGYGRISIDGAPRLTHVAAWFLYYGTWPTKKVLHTCDNPCCVRQDHLVQGTQKENMIDCAKKGRISTAKLTPAQVVEIRDGKLARPAIAKKFNVSSWVIRDVQRGRTYQWV